MNTSNFFPLREDSLLKCQTLFQLNMKKSANLIPKVGVEVGQAIDNNLNTWNEQEYSEIRVTLLKRLQNFIL